MSLKNTAILSLPLFGARGMFGPSARLFDKSADGGPGGAAGGAGSGGSGGSGGNGDDDDDDKPLTAAEITELIGKTVNQALSAKLGKAVTTAVTAALEPALEGIKAELAKAKTSDDDSSDAAPGSSGAPGKAKKGNPETEALRAELNTLKADQQKILDDAKRATEKAREHQALGLLLSELGEITSSPVVAQTVAKIMLKVDQRIEFDEETGEPAFKHRRAAYTGGPEEDVLLSIKDGIAQWAKTDDAKPFLKPPTSGGGAGAGKGPLGGGFGKPRQQSGNMPKLTDPGGVEAAMADIQSQIDARQGRAG